MRRLREFTQIVTLNKTDVFFTPASLLLHHNWVHKTDYIIYIQNWLGRPHITCCLEGYTPVLTLINVPTQHLDERRPLCFCTACWWRGQNSGNRFKSHLHCLYYLCCSPSQLNINPKLRWIRIFQMVWKAYKAKHGKSVVHRIMRR